ncbi:MAG: AGE family epimerase/isomerase [Lachnospiraceae bacterium]|nr:AGE family epimerase/isomerase [Lachnospiraceae bacterium]
MKREQFLEHLTNNLIPFWNQLEDDTFGGFYGFMDKDLKVDQHADKGVILNSRILWFYSAAYRLLRVEGLRAKAEHAFHFLKEHCYDKRRGGVYWSVSYDGKPVDTTKHTYNQAFAIYSLSEYYMATGDGDGLLLAYDLYRIIEEKCRDAEGYLESFRVDFAPDDNNEKLSENGVMAGRTMNTLLHVLEAYTNLYQADHYESVAEKLKSIIDLFKTKVYDREKGRLQVFFDLKYHSLIDLYSYGHDIEASWLLDRAAEVLGDETYAARIHAMTGVLAAEVKKHAYDERVHALYNECERGVDDKQNIWWVQAEAVVGFYNAFQKNLHLDKFQQDKSQLNKSQQESPQQDEFEQAAADIFDFIREKLVDPRCGEWYESIRPDGSINLERGMVHEWKCPYHNGRMCIEICRRMEDI